MKINRLKIADFRNHTDTDILLDRLTCVRGCNHSGKTSIAQAIEFALTGRTDATAANGAGAASLIRQGAEKAVVYIKLQANKEVDLRCSLTAASGRDVKIRDEQDAAWDGSGVKKWLESQRLVLSCLLNSRYFIGLKPAEQKALLSSIILPETYSWPAGITEQAQSVHLTINWDQHPFDVIEGAYKLAYDKRRDVNRDLKNLQIPDAIPMPEGAADADSARQRLAELRNELGGIERFHRAALFERGKVQAQLAGLEQRVSALQSKIRTEQETLDNTEKLLLSKKQVTDAQKIAAGEKRLASLEKDKSLADEQIAGIQAVLGMFDKLDGSDQCPLCRREVTPEWLVEAIQPHKEALDKAHRSRNSILGEMKELGDVEGAKRKLEENERAVASKKRSLDIIQETQSLLRTAETELEEVRVKLPPAPDEAAIEADANPLRERIDNLEESLGKIAVAEARQKEVDRAKAQQAQLSQAALTLDELVKYFGADGVKAELLAEHIGGFTAGMNAALDAWGYACEFQIEPYGFRVHHKETGTTLPLELLSGSERLRFAVAFQVALAQVSGIRMVVIDEADLLDTEGRDGLYPMLLAADVDQCIVIGTDEREEVPEVDGAIFYAMQGGRAQQLQPVGA